MTVILWQVGPSRPARREGATAMDKRTGARTIGRLPSVTAALLLALRGRRQQQAPFFSHASPPEMTAMTFYIPLSRNARKSLGLGGGEKGERSKAKKEVAAPSLFATMSVFLVDLACWRPPPENLAPLTRSPWRPGYEDHPPCSEAVRKKYPAVRTDNYRRTVAAPPTLFFCRWPLTLFFSRA